MNTKKSALIMAKRGFRVFPIMPNSKVPFISPDSDHFKKLSEQEKAWSRKVSGLAGGINVATRSPEVVERWFAKCPEMNYGVSARGLCILDVDTKKGKPGIEELCELGALPSTFKVVTPTGGLHIYFVSANVGQRNIRPSIEIRSAGGYVVGPGSVIDGKPYKVLSEKTPVALPESIKVELARVPERDTNAAESVAELDTDAAVQNAIDFLKLEPGADTGQRNVTAFRIACQLKDIGLSPPFIKEVMCDHWNDKNDEPLPDEEIEQVAINAHKSGRHAAGSSNTEAEFGDIVRELPGVLGDLFKEKGESKGPHFGPWIHDRDPADIPPRPWVVRNFLLRKGLTALVADPGTLKSTFSLSLAAGMALGSLDFFGLELVGGPKNVMIVNNEDDTDEMDRRLAAVCIQNGLDYREVTKRLHWHNPENETPFTAMYRDKDRTLKQTSRMKELRRYIKENDIKFVIIDPFAETHEGSENDNAEMARVMSLFRHSIRMGDMAGLIIHHTRKPASASTEGYAGEAYAARGASAIVGNVRVLATLCKASKDDGAELGIRDCDRGRYVRLDIGKGSYMEAGKHTRWFHIESVRIGKDGIDTAPALHLVDHADQTRRMVELVHTQLVDRIIAEGGSVPLATAAELLVEHLPEYSLQDTAGIILRNFSVPQTLQGTTLRVEGTGRKTEVRADQ